MGDLRAVTTLTAGALLGLLLQFQFASASAFLPAGAFVAHPTALVVGYLVLTGMAISEWKLLPNTGRLPRAGLVQIRLPFVGGVILTVATLLNILALYGLSTLFENAGIVLYLWRVGPRIARTRLLARGSARHYAARGVFLVVNILLVTYLIVALLSGAFKSFAAIPFWLIFAFDHGMFIGVQTNALFGLIQDATQARRNFWPWADDVLFWGMNLGLIGFVLSLLSNSRQYEPFVTPIMGGSILVALLASSIRLLMQKPALVKSAPEAQG